MVIAFTANHDKTIFYHEIGRRLVQEGHTVLWISSSVRWTRWLENEGVASEHICRVYEHSSAWENVTHVSEVGASQREALAALARESNAWTTANLILMDRVLSTKSYSYGLAFLHTCAEVAEDFLRSRNVRILISENTWALELIAVQVGLRLGICCVNPHPARIPHGRFGFFLNPLQAELLKFREVTQEDRREAKRIVTEFRNSKPKPERYYELSRIPTPQRSWIPNLFAHLRQGRFDRFDEMRFPVRWLIRKKISEVTQAQAVRLTRPFQEPPLPPERPFVLLTLHKQPESSIDVLGAYVSNQLELIRAVARSVPATHDLYVKEHAHAIGDRPLSFYRVAARIPGVRLIDPFLDSQRLLEHADLTVTVSGTVAYEAGMLGKRAVSLTPMFFGNLLLASGVDPYSGGSWLRELLDVDEGGLDERASPFIADLLTRTFPGIIGDPRNAPASMTSENLDLITAGFRKLIAETKAAPSNFVRS